MNTYLYAPKDDPYHREKWTEPYPAPEWKKLRGLIAIARAHGIDFVYGFHPGKDLRFNADAPIQILLAKAARFYRAGVRTFAVLFDDIPSRLEHLEDQKKFSGSLARAEANWLARIIAQQPRSWTAVEWWICPSRYSDDPLLPRTFGSFEPRFLETFAEHLPAAVACFWTGPNVVSKKIGLSHVRKIAKRLQRRLILWDNYPVNDLSMRKEMHLAPLTGRDPRLPEEVYGFLSNPLLQEELSFIPLATCFDYASAPRRYDPEKSWRRIILERFGMKTLPHWRAIRRFCAQTNKGRHPLAPAERRRLEGALRYLDANERQRWCGEFSPWRDAIEDVLRQTHGFADRQKSRSQLT